MTDSASTNFASIDPAFVDAAPAVDPAGPIARLLERNERFAAHHHRPLTAAPKLRTCIVTCPDPRVDPAQILGLELGDAAVVRAAAGRVSPIVLQQLLFLAQTAAAIGQPQDGLELVLMQHTDCGITHFLEAEHREMLAAFLGCAPDELDAKAPGDPYAGVRVDIEALAANPFLPASLSVAGMVYDVGSGRVELVERRSPLRADR
jgi:carbonic anhydrase